jgi:hypothetical protein
VVCLVEGGFDTRGTHSHEIEVRLPSSKSIIIWRELSFGGVARPAGELRSPRLASQRHPAVAARERAPPGHSERNVVRILDGSCGFQVLPTTH